MKLVKEVIVLFKLITRPVSTITILTPFQLARVPHVPDIILPYVFHFLKTLCDHFLEKNLPDYEAIFNYHLSCARRIIENTFGILATRFRIFRHPINADPDRVVAYTKATNAFHNYL